MKHNIRLIKNMKKIIFLIFAVVFSADSFAQKIELATSFGNFELKRNGVFITTLSELEQIVAADINALEYVKKARTNKTISDISGFIGGFGIGYSIGSLLGKNKTYAPALLGLGFIVIKIPFINGINKNLKLGTDAYNTSLDKKVTCSNNFNPSFELVGNSDGVGFSIKF